MSSLQDTKWTELPTPPGFNTIKEGTAAVLVPDGNQVFYNEVQEFNRDLSILVISQFATNVMEEKSMKAQQFLDKKNDNKSTRKDTTTQSEPIMDDAGIEQPTKKQKQSQESQTSPTPTINISSDDDLVSLSNGSPKPCQTRAIPPRLQYQGVRIFEALSASGLRSIRYFNEIPYVDTIHVNDMDTEAVESIRRNVLYNQLPLDRVIPNRNEATAALYANRATTHDLVRKLNVHKESTLPSQPDSIDPDHPLAFLYKQQHTDTTSITSDFIPKLPLWNVVDLDPYGSAAPFLDAAIQAVEDDGLLCVTCTDGAVLCGNYMETGFGKYNAIPLHSSDISKEFGLRMLLHTIESTASKYGRTITPLLSLSIDFYVRVFVKVTTSQAQVKFSGSRHVFLGQCVSCRTTFTSRCMQSTPQYDPNLHISKQTGAKHTHGPNPLSNICELCQSRIRICGPIWGDAIHDPHFVKQCLQTLEHRTYRADQLNADNVLSKESNDTSNTQPKDGYLTAVTTAKLAKKQPVPPLLSLTPIPRIISRFGTYQRIKGMLTMAYSELPHGIPISLASISQALSISTPKFEVIQSAFLNAGYAISETHTAPNTFKTNAPASFYMDVIRGYLVMHNGSLSKPWPQCSKSPRQWVAGNNVCDSNGEPIQFDPSEAQLVEDFKADEGNKLFVQYHDELTKILPTSGSQPSHLTPSISISAERIAWNARNSVVPEAKEGGRAPKPLNQAQLMSCWIMSQPIRHQINFKARQRVKIPVFFENPSAYWGPKAAAGSFDTRNYTTLTMGEEANGENQTKNISRALALAQQQRAIDNQHRFTKQREKRTAAEAMIGKSSPNQEEGETKMTE